MGYKSKTRQQQYQRCWLANRRAMYLNGRSCIRCGSAGDLEVHHRDSGRRVTHRVWSWTQRRRKAELKKCDVLCHACHTRLTEENVQGPYRYSAAFVQKVRTLFSANISLREIARRTGMSYSQVQRITAGEQRAASSSSSA